MKLWKLEQRPIQDISKLPFNPWATYQDTCAGAVVRAGSEQAARAFMSKIARGEASCIDPWATDMYTTCIEVTVAGDEEAIMVDVVYD